MSAQVREWEAEEGKGLEKDGRETGRGLMIMFGFMRCHTFLSPMLSSLISRSRGSRCKRVRAPSPRPPTPCPSPPSSRPGCRPAERARR